MPDARRTTCQICRKHKSEVGDISWRGNCRACGRARADQAMDELHYGHGPMFDLWLARLRASVGMGTFDTPPPTA
jgi:hypothetical protein